VDHQVDLSTTGRFQSAGEVGEEVRTAATALNPGPNRVVEPEVGICQEQHAHDPIVRRPSPILIPILG